MFVTDFPGICNFFENAESTVKQKFKRKQEQYKQLGIMIDKQGRGKAATYSVNVDLNIIKTIVDKPYPNELSTLNDVKDLKNWIAANSEYCFVCKKWINKNNSNRIVLPSASGKTELLCACCNSCFEDGYYVYSL